MAFDLSNLIRGKQPKPPRVVLYAGHGIGKSTFAASAPSPIFIQTEDGLGNIDTTAFPLATTFSEVIEALDTLIGQEHDFQTVAIDSLDWMEQLIWFDIEQRYSEKETAYGKGAMIAVDNYWRPVLDRLNILRNQRSMAVILLAHCEVKKFDSPEVDSYERYQIKLQARASAVVQEWADVVGFANFRTLVLKEEKTGFDKVAKTRGTTTGERLLYLVEKPAYVAKNRYGLPEQLPLSWQAFSDALTVSLTTA